MYHLEGEMAHSLRANSLGKLCSWIEMHDVYQKFMKIIHFLHAEVI